MSSVKNTELFKAMKSSNNYDDDEHILESIAEMKQAVENGEDPHDVLHDEGFEPDYIFDLL